MNNSQRLTTPNAQLLERMGALLYNDEVIIFERYSFHYQDRIVRSPYAIIVFIDRGTAEIIVDDRPYKIVANDQLLLLPEQPTQLLSLSEDFHARFVLMSHEFVNYITNDDTYLFIQVVRNNPLIHLPQHVTNAYCSCYDLIKATILQSENPYRRQMLQHIVKAYLYGIVYCAQPNMPVARSREEEITYRFMDLVDIQFRVHHTLSFYAEQLHLSAKYISKCVKQTSGKNALKCITERLMNQAKAMLLIRQNTIAQIGYELGFSDQSAFGKFFHQQEGIGPRKWREMHLQDVRDISRS